MSMEMGAEKNKRISGARNVTSRLAFRMRRTALGMRGECHVVRYKPGGLQGRERTQGSTFFLGTVGGRWGRGIVFGCRQVIRTKNKDKDET